MAFGAPFALTRPADHSANLQAGPTDPHSPKRDMTEEEAAVALDLIGRGRSHTARSYVDSLSPTCDGEPLFLIIRARCFQETVPMDDADNTLGRSLSRPSLDDLDRCIKICTQRLKVEDPDPRLRLYRGWAWMAKAYVRSMTQNLFTAGREAKRGKKDLERYLEHDPEDPTAKGLLGGYLYFADTIPAAYKFFSKLLFLPTGDRDLGLQYLRTAVQRGGLLENDFKLILYNVYFYFEGRYEEGLAGLQEMNELYPEYARTAIPLAVSRPYVPRLTVRNDELVEATINSVYSAPHRDVNWSALYVVQVYRAYGDRYCNHSSTTRARLRGIIHEAPRHPDWVEPFARLELGRLYASLGHRDEAAVLFESVSKSDTFGYLRDEAKALLKDLTKYADYFDAPSPPNLDAWIAALYQADRDSLTKLRSRFNEHATSSLAAAFYVGECDLLTGDFDRALKSYKRVISEEAPAWNHTYQLIASTRIAEIFAQRGRYEEAAKQQAHAMTFYHREYLVDWVVEGRQRYFERLAEGKESVPPTLLSVIP